MHHSKKFVYVTHVVVCTFCTSPSQLRYLEGILIKKEKKEKNCLAIKNEDRSCVLNKPF